MPRPAPYVAFANRLQRACDESGVPGGRKRVTAVATHFGVARETARLWFAGRALPELSRLIEMAGEYRCSLDWLAMGRQATPEGGRVSEQAAGYETLSAQERAVVAAMRGLTEKRRAGLVALLSER
jgi:transcriptional regulator with XRE-family HTH domain